MWFSLTRPQRSAVSSAVRPRRRRAWPAAGGGIGHEQAKSRAAALSRARNAEVIGPTPPVIASEQQFVVVVPMWQPCANGCAREQERKDKQCNNRNSASGRSRLSLTFCPDSCRPTTTATHFPFQICIEELERDDLGPCHVAIVPSAVTANDTVWISAVALASVKCASSPVFTGTMRSRFRQIGSAAS